MKTPRFSSVGFSKNGVFFRQLRHVIIAKFALLLIAFNTPLAVAQSTPAGAYPRSLPPEALARTAIAGAPLTELARLNWLGEQSQARLLRAGSHEWTVKATLQRRVEQPGKRFIEPELVLERGLRWGDKAAIDNRLAEAGQAAALSSYEDAWHESARTLLKAWFDTAREESTVHSLAGQVVLAGKQWAVVHKRVAAGDAPRLEALLAQGELERSEAALASARQRAQALRVEFDRRYPALQALALDAQQLASSPDQDASAANPAAQDAMALEQAILADNHEIELAKANTELARLRFARTDQDRRGDPTVGVRYARERGGQDNLVGISVAIPFGGVARDARAELAAIEASKAETREREVLARVGYEATQAARAVALSHQIAGQLTAAARQATAAANLTVKAYAEGETPLGSLLQAHRQASEAQLAATLAQVTSQEAAARALLDAHQLWTPTPLNHTSHP